MENFAFSGVCDLAEEAMRELDRTWTAMQLMQPGEDAATVAAFITAATVQCEGAIAMLRAARLVMEIGIAGPGQ